MALTWHQAELAILRGDSRVGSTTRWGWASVGDTHGGSMYLVIPKLNLEREAALSVVFGTTWQTLLSGSQVWLGGLMEFTPLQVGRFELYVSGDPSVTELAGVVKGEGDTVPTFLSMVRATSILMKEPR